jgi:hypothetical protein
MHKLALMMMRKLQSGPFAERARRSVREITLAVVLTLAAVVFAVAALHGHGSETAAISSSEDPAVNTPN